MLLGHIVIFCVVTKLFRRVACQCLAFFSLTYLLFFVIYFTFVSVRLYVSLELFLHGSQASMALLSAWLVNCQVKNANILQQMLVS